MTQLKVSTQTLKPLKHRFIEIENPISYNISDDDWEEYGEQIISALCDLEELLISGSAPADVVYALNHIVRKEYIETEKPTLEELVEAVSIVHGIPADTIKKYVKHDVIKKYREFFYV